MSAVDAGHPGSSGSPCAVAAGARSRKSYDASTAIELDAHRTRLGSRYTPAIALDDQSLALVVETVTCDNCDGRGWIKMTSIPYDPRTACTCPRCDGKGTVPLGSFSCAQFDEEDDG